MNYDFNHKNHWRNSVWNKLTRRTLLPPEDAIVLYLAAEKDLDRPTALERGFVSNNLIGVDRDGTAVDKIRAAGNLCIHGDLMDVMTAWPEHTPVCAVIADFTCGLEAQVVKRFSHASIYKGMRDALFVVNVLRGRDASSNDIRARFQRVNSVNRRGEIFAYEQNGFASIVTGSPCGALAGCGDHQLAESRPHSQQQKAREMRMAMESGSYRSGPQRFDWAIWSNRRDWSGMHPEFELPINEAQAEIRRQISAILAHRTRRLAV